MVFNPGNQMLAQSFGQKQQIDLNEDTMQDLMSLDQGKANETKMSDNEAFMAYMNKAGGNDEEDDD